MKPPTVRLSTLFLEDLRALPRHAFGLGGVAALLVLILGFGYAAAHGEDGFSFYVFFTWVVGPLLLAPILATRIAAARRTRFVDSLFTTPLTQRTWLVAQVLVGATLLVGLMIAAAPFVIVSLWHMAAPLELTRLFLAGLAVGAFAIALGVFCGVIVGDAGPASAGSLAAGAAMLSFFGFIVQMIVAGGELGTLHPAFLRVAHVSPIALATDAVGSGIGGIATDAWVGAALGLGVLIAGLALAGWIAYTRQQGPLGWEAGRGLGARWVIGVLVALAVLTPVALASTSYHGARDNEGFGRGDDSDLFLRIAPRGAAITDASLTILHAFDQEPLSFEEDNARDVLVVLRVPVSASVSDLVVTFDGGDTFAVTGGLDAPAPTPAARAHETRGIGFPGDPLGEERNVYRVPVTVHPTKVDALFESRHHMLAHVSYVVDGERHSTDSGVLLSTDVPGAGTQLLLAGTPLPLACVAGLVTRKLRTR